MSKMENDIEKVLNQVGTPIGGPFKHRVVFKFLNVRKFENREFRLKFLKITSAVFMAVIVVLLFVGHGGGQALKIQKTNNIKSNNEAINKVARLIILPEEDPVIAVIAKIELLKDKPFFAGAKNGDKVLLFTKADKAILYDPLANKIINVGTGAETGIKP